MQGTTFRLPVDDGVELHVARWLPDDGKPKAVVQIAHGMAEHGARYARTAEVLTGAGYAVYADDHRGHGQSALVPGDLGYFADRDGWRRIVDDLYALRNRIREEHPDVPLILMGHSMGSFMAQDFLFTHGDSIDAVVLSGTNMSQPALTRVGRGVAVMERLRLGQRGVSQVVQTLSTGEYNKRIPEPRTIYDWITRDPAEVDLYVSDPLCGFEFTVQAWIDMFDGLIRIGAGSNIRRVPKHLPVYLFAGAEDPVGRFGKGPLALADAYRAAGLTDVEQRLYEGGRHEMLNETNRDEVHRDLVVWLDRALERCRQRAA